MPTVLTLNGFAVRVYSAPREHGPAHVHVFYGREEVLINLSPVGVRENRGMRGARVVTAVRIVENHLDECLAAWRERHG